jgi:hypothetical protein
MSPKCGSMLEIRFDDLAVRQVEAWDRNPDCPVCQDVKAAL